MTERVSRYDRSLGSYEMDVRLREHLADKFTEKFPKVLRFSAQMFQNFHYIDSIWVFLGQEKMDVSE